jgi:hypothetical protein
MPRYFFDTDDGVTVIEDEEGIDLYSLKEARLQDRPFSPTSPAITSPMTDLRER